MKHRDSPDIESMVTFHEALIPCNVLRTNQTRGAIFVTIQQGFCSKLLDSAQSELHEEIGILPHQGVQAGSENFEVLLYFVVGKP